MLRKEREREKESFLSLDARRREGVKRAIGHHRFAVGIVRIFTSGVPGVLLFFTRIIILVPALQYSYAR